MFNVAGIARKSYRRISYNRKSVYVAQVSRFTVKIDRGLLNIRSIPSSFQNIPFLSPPPGSYKSEKREVKKQEGFLVKVSYCKLVG